MVHAEAATFSPNISKQDAYAQVLEQAAALFDDQRNWVCNLANTASLLWHAYKSLPHPSNKVNWAGFYTLSPTLPNSHLILGPFQGKVACQTIAFGRGVCGTAVSTTVTQLVDDVAEFPGHITCDGESASEIVVPVVCEGKVVAVLDVDCAVKGGFDEVDRRALEALAGLLARSCDW